MTIEWWTDTAGDSTVEYGLTTALGSSVTVGQAGSCEVGGAGTCHTVPITGLLPGTQYFYQLRTGGQIVQAVSSGIYFTTLKSPLDPTQFFFTMIGDWGACPSATFNCGSTAAEQAVANHQNTADPPV